MSAPLLINIAGLALCAASVAQAAIDAVFAGSARVRIGSMAIGAVALAGVVSFMARTASMVLA